MWKQVRVRLLNASAFLQIVIHTSVTNMEVCLKHGCVTAWVSRCYLGEYSVIRNDATKKYCACACIRVCICAELSPSGNVTGIWLVVIACSTRLSEGLIMPVAPYSYCHLPLYCSDSGFHSGQNNHIYLINKCSCIYLYSCINYSIGTPHRSAALHDSPPESDH